MRILASSSTPNFKAGKVYVYSDFDGTYFPDKHSRLTTEKYKEHSKFLDKYCNKMEKFFAKTDGDVFFCVSTGRSYGEYQTVFELIRSKGYKLPLPNSLIAKNGSDEYYRTSSSNFYDGNDFPFSYNKADSIKKEKLKKSHNWNGEELRDFISNLAEKYKLKLIEADSENSVKDYGEKSLYSEGKLKDVAPNSPVLGSRNDGNIKRYLVFSPNSEETQEKFMDEIKKHLSEKQVKFHINKNKESYHCTGYSIAPEVDNREITKLYDSREALKRAVKNNDLVITAGDGINDFEMLNPLEYLDKEFFKECEAKSSYKDFYSANTKKKLEILEKVYLNSKDSYSTGLRKELETNGFFKKIEELPFCGIIIKDGESELQCIAKAFSKTGKIIEVETGKLDEGIIKASKMYASKNMQFKKGMSEKFKSYLFKTHLKLTAGITSALILFAGIVYKIKQSNNKM